MKVYLNDEKKSVDPGLDSTERNHSDNYYQYFQSMW